jgi:large subunit ribosomal protein L31
MKKNIHPKMHEVDVTCTCGATFKTRSTQPSIHATLCSQCHPHFTGQQKLVDVAGRIDKFQKKYAKRGKQQ